MAGQWLQGLITHVELNIRAPLKLLPHTYREREREREIRNEEPLAWELISTCH